MSRLGRAGTPLIVVAVLAIGGCGGLSPVPVDASPAPDAVAEPSASSSSAPPLVHVRWTGGLCPEGVCESEQWILRDGTVMELRADAQPPRRIAPDRLRALIAAVEQADYAAIMARPFIGTCPTAYDGQEVTYTFFVGDRAVRVASCETAVDAADPPFRQLATAREGA